MPFAVQFRNLRRRMLAVVGSWWIVAAGPSPTPAAAQSAGAMAYQGRVVVAGAPFEGTGAFKFALVNAGATEVLWRNAPDADADGIPDQAVNLAVSRGLYQVQLGDSTLANMAGIPVAVLGGRVAGMVSDPVFLRVWFNDGVHGFQRLSPDQKIGAAPFALAAATVADGAVTPAKMAPGTVITSAQPADSGLLAAGYATFAAFPAPPWVTSAASGGPSARYAHAAAWVPASGAMFVWGGQVAANTYSDTGALFRPAADDWQTANPTGAPSARRGASVVRVGAQRVAVWGGQSAAGFLNTGAIFDLATLNWTDLPVPPGLSGRDGHVAVAIGSSMLVWGGRDSSGRLGDGSLYDAVGNAWSLLTLSGAPGARSGAAAVLAGDRILIWGGAGVAGPEATGAQLIFQTSPTLAPTEWRAMDVFDAPAARTDHAAVWTGSRFIVWGGRSGGTLRGDGGIYDPVGNVWESVPTTGAPSARAGHVAVWTGAEMVVFGGETATGVTATGGAYDPVKRTWRPLNAGGNPVARTLATGVWTGTEILVFGGQSATFQPLAALQRLVPQPDWFLYRKL